MKLETPLLDEFCRFARAVPGCEMNAVFRAPDGTSRNFDLVALLMETHTALHSLHHFADPTGARNDAFRPEPLPLVDNPTGQAAIGI